MKKATAPHKTYAEQERWAARERKTPKQLIPDPAEGGSQVIYQVQQKHNRLLEIVGSCAVIGIIAFVGDYGFRKIQHAASTKTVCEKMATGNAPTHEALGAVRVNSAISIPSAADLTIGVANSFYYSLDSATATKSLPRSCAMVVEVATVVDDSLFSQTALATTSKVASSQLTVSSIFTALNNNIINASTSADAKNTAYGACEGELHILADAVKANAELFANSEFPASFLQDATPKQRIDYAPYTAVPAPGQNYRELIFTDKTGGVLSCTKPS